MLDFEAACFMGTELFSFSATAPKLLKQACYCYNTA